MKNKFTKLSLFHRYLLSYLLILLLPVLFLSFFIYTQFMSVYENEIINGNLNTLNKTKYILDNNMRQINNIQYNMVLNSSFVSYIMHPNVLSSMEVCNKLREFKVANNFVHEVGFFVRGDKYIYTDSTSYTLDSFYNHAYNYRNWTEDDFINTLASSTKPVIRSAETIKNYSNTSSFITLIYPLSFSGSKPLATAIFLIDEKVLNGIMLDTLSITDADSFIIGPDNEIITSINNDEHLLSLNIIDIMESDSSNQFFHKTEVNNIQYLISVVKSPESNLKYVSFTPINKVMQKLIFLRIKYILLLFIILVLGCLAIYINMKKNYNPIKNLQKYTQKILKKDFESKNELESVRGAFDYLSSQNTKLIQTTKVASRDFILLELLRGRIKVLEEFNSKGKDFNIYFDNISLTVCIIMVQPDNNFVELNNQGISQAFEKILSQYFHGYILSLVEGNKLVSIISHPNQDLSFTEKLYTLHDTLKKLYRINLTIGVSNTYDKMEYIPKSYIEAASALDYRLIKGNDNIIFYKEIILQEYSLDEYPVKELDILKNLIIQGNVDEIEHVLSDILNYIKTCDIALFTARRLCFDLVNITSKAMAEVNMKFATARNNGVNPIMLAEFETVEELTDAVKNICFNICSFIRENKTVQDTELITNIRLFIQENYTKCDFSIQSMADHFQMTLTSLSKYFKNQTGHTIIDYVSVLRMEKAKEMLISTNLTLNDISLSVGYYNYSSFLRRFRQITGLTPGQFVKDTVLK